MRPPSLVAKLSGSSSPGRWRERTVRTGGRTWPTPRLLLQITWFFGVAYVESNPRRSIQLLEPMLTKWRTPDFLSPLGRAYIGVGRIDEGRPCSRRRYLSTRLTHIQRETGGLSKRRAPDRPPICAQQWLLSPLRGITLAQVTGRQRRCRPLRRTHDRRSLLDHHSAARGQGGTDR